MGKLVCSKPVGDDEANLYIADSEREDVLARQCALFCIGGAFRTVFNMAYRKICTTYVKSRQRRTASRRVAATKQYREELKKHPNKERLAFSFGCFF